MDGEVTTDGQYYYQQVGENLVLIPKEAYEAIQEKNKAKLKLIKDTKAELKKQWLKEFGKEFLNPEEAFKQFEEEKELIKRE